MPGHGNELAVLGKEKKPNVIGTEYMMGGMEGMRLDR